MASAQIKCDQNIWTFLDVYILLNVLEIKIIVLRTQIRSRRGMFKGSVYDRNTIFRMITLTLGKMFHLQLTSLLATCQRIVVFL